MSYSTQRIARLRALMKREAYDFFYIRNTSNILWLSAFDDVFDSEDAHALVVSQDKVILHTDSRYSEAAQRKARGTDISVDASFSTHAQFFTEELARWAKQKGGTCKIALESSISLEEYRALERELNQLDKTYAQVVTEETQGCVVGLRGIKDAEEIRRLKTAQAITDAAFSHIIDFLCPGMTERAVQIELEDYMIRHGAAGLAFSSIVACGPNAALPHAIPSETLIESGQCIVFDFGARYGSYCSDMTRTLFVGSPSPKLRHAYAALRETNESLEAFLRPGVSGAQAQELAEKLLTEAGYSNMMRHALGHGVGIDVHEQPMLASHNTRELVEGNVVTIEPGIYKPGDFGMRLEDFGIIKKDGLEVFTQSSHDMVII